MLLADAMTTVMDTARSHGISWVFQMHTAELMQILLTAQTAQAEMVASHSVTTTMVSI